MITAYIALGSNQGDAAGQVHQAFERLRGLSACAPAFSSLWRSAPVDCPPGSPEFINAVAAIAPLPGETPESLLRKLQSLERQAGRKPKLVMNEPRPLDLDLIAFGDELRHGPELVLPHPRAALRGFVLAPLAEIASELRLPGQGMTVRELLNFAAEDRSLRKF